MPSCPVPKEQLMHALDAIVQGHSDSKACKFAGIDRNTLMKYRREDQRFQQQYKEADKKRTDLKMSNIKEAALSGLARRLKEGDKQIKRKLVEGVEVEVEEIQKEAPASLHIFALKKALPEIFDDTEVESGQPFRIKLVPAKPNEEGTNEDDE